mmetsp:Transcript_36621/g.117441  ORF Transcript_36621/g.117441 Transcript_36621/m.117441 type:complete len:202 (-) Transcript_36621:922-1527(-)
MNEWMDGDVFLLVYVAATTSNSLKEGKGRKRKESRRGSLVYGGPERFVEGEDEDEGGGEHECDGGEDGVGVVGLGDVAGHDGEGDAGDGAGGSEEAHQKTLRPFSDCFREPADDGGVADGVADGVHEKESRGPEGFLRREREAPVDEEKARDDHHENATGHKFEVVREFSQELKGQQTRHAHGPTHRDHIADVGTGHLKGL